MLVVLIKRDQDVRLGIVGRDGACRDVIGHSSLVRKNSLLTAGRIKHNIDQVAVFQSASREIILVDEDNIAAAGDAPVAVVQAIDRRIVLIMASDRRERKSPFCRKVLLKSRIDQKVRSLRRRSGLCRSDRRAL